MNIISALAEYAQNRIGKLMYDANGNAYLYNAKEKYFKEIIVYPLEKFRPFQTFDLKDKNREEKKRKWESSFDNVQVYSVKIGEEIIDGVNTPKLRFGFINEKGYAITHATYDRVQAFQYGRAIVYLDDNWCIIDLQGRPLLDGQPFNKAEYVSQYSYADYTICSVEGKYGLINKYRYLCLPCEYDRIDYKKSRYGYDYFVMEKNHEGFVAIIEGTAIINIIKMTPISLELIKNFLLVEEEYRKDGNVYTKWGLLNRGGIRILKSEYDSIHIAYKNIGIVSKDNLKQILFIGEKGFKVFINSSEDIKYGEAYDEEREIKYCYASVNDHEIVYLEYEDKNGLHSMENYGFHVENMDIFEDVDRVYFSYNGSPNNYLAIVSGDKTKLVDIFGNEIMPLVIPSDYYVLTDTYSEGIVGICLDGSRPTKECSFINSEGKVLTDFSYYEVEKFENGKAKVYFSDKYISGTEIIDKEGKIISRESEPNDPCPPDNTWADLIDDAYEGDPDAYWNTE